MLQILEFLDLVKLHQIDDDGGYVYPLATTESPDAYPYSTTTTYSQPLQTQPMPTDQITASTNWLPLGVFAVANNTNAAAYTNRFIQLAINRSGEIAGVLYNSQLILHKILLV